MSNSEHTAKLVQMLSQMSDQDLLHWKHKTKKSAKAEYPSPYQSWNRDQKPDMRPTFEHTYTVKHENSLPGIPAFECSFSFTCFDEARRYSHDHILHNKLVYEHADYTYDTLSISKPQREQLTTAIHSAIGRQQALLMEATLNEALTVLDAAAQEKAEDEQQSA